jgi:hypothetical protein
MSTGLSPIAWPARSRVLTWLTYAYGLAFFVWIGVEDSTPARVTALGGVLPLLFLAHFLTRRFGGAPLPARKGMLLLGAGGLLAGSAAPFTVAILMGVKVSLHSHAYPEYPPEAVTDIIARTPVWALAGLLLGVAAALVAHARRRSPV